METFNLWIAPRAFCEFAALLVRAALSILPRTVAGLSQEQGDSKLAEDNHTERLNMFVFHVYHHKKTGREILHTAHKSHTE